MSMLSRSFAVAVLTLAVGGTSLAAQAPVQGDFQWYVGGQAGVLVFRTPSQTRGGNFAAGAHTLITARRTGLLLSVEEAIGDSTVSSYYDDTGTIQDVEFNDIRKYSAVLMAFPVRSAAQPYIGVGVGILHAVNPQPPETAAFASPAARAQAEADATDLGTNGFVTAVGGLQFKVGRFVAFGQYQITSTQGTKTLESGASGRLFNGATHTFTGGMRISLGSAKETPRSFSQGN
ncbi:MAG TPA: hypothetical protein VFU46_11890 [Gemmatimonadales bacterium]|nr:hypothetical protein [Gemmatimonadales bacterium]